MQKRVRLALAAATLTGSLVAGAAFAQHQIPTKPSDGCVKVVETISCDAKGNCVVISTTTTPVDCP